ncbi:MAG: hypothetical protein CVV17_12410, partial [Gammaproteobacteria bacterium HGW-Gammaproteobacteria-7]
MRETASELVIAQDAVERERGVILAERRDRAGFQQRNFEDNLAFLAPGARYAERLPIGTVDVLENATAAQIRALYERTYTPANTVLVVVGDYEVATVEAAIRARFADWQPAAAPAEPAALPPVAANTAAISEAVDNAFRDPNNVARDASRNPLETLSFFGVTDTQTVLEIYPGGGWYAEILVPLLREKGQYIGAIIDPASASNERAQAYYAEQGANLRAKFAANEDAYGQPTLIEVDVNNPVFGAPGSVDTVLTFRNVHNWLMAGPAPAMFQGFYDVLKPGGVLGVVEHRASADVPEGDRSGYVGQAQTIALAEAAGFVLEQASEINANPADTKDHEA